MKGHRRTAHRPRRGVAAGCCLAAALAVTAAAGCAAGRPGARPAGGTPPPCSRPSRTGPGKPRPTTVTTIGQAYFCIFRHYYAGPRVDDRVLLAGAFAGLTQQLDRLGVDQADATMPALTGQRIRDWDAFAAVYRRVSGRLPARSGLRQRVAAAAITGMVAALHDNHAGWFRPPRLPPFFHRPGAAYGLGITTSPSADVLQGNPGAGLPPLFVTVVDPRSPAARAGVRPGDVIAAVDGAPPFLDGTLTPGVVSLLNQFYPRHQPVRITLRSPVTGAERTITITPARYRLPPRPPMTAQLLRGHIGYVALSGFDPGTASGALDAIRRLREKVPLRGMILDLRGNGGGAPSQVASLLGAFEHGRPWGYFCTITGRCTASYPDRAMPLLHLPLAVLTDRNCESACDAFAAAVKDLHLGALIGTRTAGIASGPASGWLLDDGSILGLPTEHALGAHHEIIDGIGVAPDFYLPYTAKDLAGGHDPDIAKALALLGRQPARTQRSLAGRSVLTSASLGAR